MSFYLSLHLVLPQCFLSPRYIRLREKNAKRNVNVYLCISPSSASAQRFSWIFCGFCSNPKQKSISFCSVGLLLLLSLLLSLLFSYSKLFGRRFDIHACFVWCFSNRVSSHQLKNLSLWNGFRMYPFFFFFFCFVLLLLLVWNLANWLISWWLWFVYVSARNRLAFNGNSPLKRNREMHFGECQNLLMQ